MTSEMISKLETIGFKRWTKGSYDRLYVNANTLGLECEYYNTGNIHYAEFNGERVSNSEARRMKGAKTYIDINTGKVWSDNVMLKEKAEEILEMVTA